MENGTAQCVVMWKTAQVNDVFSLTLVLKCYALFDIFPDRFVSCTEKIMYSRNFDPNKFSRAKLKE